MVATTVVEAKRSAVVAILVLEAEYGLQFKISIGSATRKPMALAAAPPPRGTRKSGHRPRKVSATAMSTKPSMIESLYGGLE